MIKHITAIVMALLATSTVAAAQTMARPLPPGAEIGIVSVDPIAAGRVVRDAPYTADAVTEVTQVLADGNRIEQRTSATVARDSQGRTRREQQGIALGAFVAKNQQPIVTISDPESGVTITLNYDLKVAFRARSMMRPDIIEYRANAVAGGQASFEIAIPADPVAGGVQRDVVAGVAGVMVAPPLATMMSTASTVDEALEPKMLEGVTVEGTRRTTTIPAGAVGNVQPIEMVFERWYSPELQVIVMTRRFDPRFGETIYRLTNIQRSEPAPELFKAPADFRIEDMRPGTMMPVRPDGA